MSGLGTVDSGVFYGKDYLGWPFAGDYWFTRNYLPQVAQGSLPDAPFNDATGPTPSSFPWCRGRGASST